MVKDENITVESKKKFLSFRMFKKRRQKGFFRALLCCFRPEVTQGVAHKPSKEIGPELENYSLLPQSNSCDSNKLCLVIDLDETLVHSSFRPTDDADFVIPIDIDGNVHSVYVLKRPYVDEFLQSVGKLYECVLFTASLAEYADPVANLLDQWGVFKWRLFRDSCVFFKGGYVKDLGKLGRDLRKVVIIDNSPASYCFHRNNAVPIASWFEDTSDTQLRDLIPFFEKLSTVDNVYSVLKNSDKGSTEMQNLACNESREIIHEPMNVTSPISNIPHP